MYSLQTKKTSSKHLKASDDGPFVFFGKGRLEYGSASLDGVADGLRCKFRYLVVNQALVATVYSHNLPTVEDGSPCDGPNSRIHSGSVSAGGEHSHSRNLCNNQLK